MRGLLGLLVALALIGGAYLYGRDYVRRYPQDFPWTELDLRHPVGAFTGRKLALLDDEPARCRMLLRGAGVDDPLAPPRRAGPECGYDDGMLIGGGNAREFRYRPQPLVTSCPVAAALFLLEERVVQPAALRHFGRRVTSVQHLGSYSCRRLYGRNEGPFSEHATADAIDIAGFRLEDGTQVSVLRDWNDDGPKGDFLRDVRDGACRLFSTVLSPDYNEAHADHLHLDQAERGAMGWRLCS